MAQRLLAISLFTWALVACSPATQCDGGACGACAVATKSCAVDGDCCSGLSCTSGVCRPACAVAGAACTGGALCCDGLSCTDGVCACLGVGDTCGEDGGQTCCGGLSCDGTGHCSAPCATAAGACQPFSAACTSSADCCSPGACVAGKCSDPSVVTTCGQEGAPCATKSDCCGAESRGSQLDCVPGTDGGNVCHLGLLGEACDANRRCISAARCVVPVVDAGVVDAGFDDAGVAIDAGVFDAGVQVGTCLLPSTGVTCTVNSASCNVGDACNPSSAVNQDYDPCFLGVSGGSLGYRQVSLICHASRCTLPLEGEPCDPVRGCLQTGGDNRQTTCVRGFDRSYSCVPGCTVDSECQGSDIADRINNAQPVTNYCVSYGRGRGCQPKQCFSEGATTALGNVGNLYKPCTGVPNSLCLPRFSGGSTNVEGFCAPVRAGAMSTVGQACDARFGLESSLAFCGPDSVCMGGRCAALCDAAALGTNGTPVCDKSKTCVSPQGLDLVSSYQFGGCVDPCDPFTTLEHSGCVNYCGGPPARCNWIVGDPKAGLPRGYCGAAVKTPLRAGAPCAGGAVDSCETGSRCMTGPDGATRECTRLCDPTAAAGTNDACPAGQRCTAFASLTRSGYCQ